MSIPVAGADLLDDVRHVAAGLRGSVEILIDVFGIPHIYGSEPADVYLAQGFAAARDRLWQMEVWRRRGHGKLAELFGAEYVAADRARRLFLFRGREEEEWRAMGNEARATLDAFAAGINAYLDLLGRGVVTPPHEFTYYGIAPTRWSAMDIVRVRSGGLRSNVTDEFARMRLVAHGCASLDAERRRRRPDVPLEIDRGTLPEIPANALDVYRLAIAEDPFSVVRSGPAQDLSTASNVWALAAHRSATGRPILANDPHRQHGLPSLRWLVHLEAPGLECIGATEPTHPGVSNGHNGKVAFGFTYSACDQEDLLIYPVSDANHVKTAHGPREIETITECVAVRDASSVAVELRFVDGDPIIFSDPDGRYHIAVRSAFLRPGGAPYIAGINYHRASSLGDFERLIAATVAPTMNYCAADIKGIGIFVRGEVPDRGGRDGALPADGTIVESYRPLPTDALPAVRSPRSGWVANCNQPPMGLADAAAAVRLGREFSDSARFDRLVGLLEAKERHDLDDCAAYQCDQTLAYAPALVRDLLACWAGCPIPLRTILEDWRGNLAVASPAAAFFATWLETYLRPAVIEQRFPAAVRQECAPFDLDLVLHPRPDEAVMVATAQAALESLTVQLGVNHAAWQLGDVQGLTLRRSEPGLEGVIGPFAVGGHAHTLNKASTDATLAVNFGPSFRLLIDVGDWDQSRVINLPGQSGDTSSPHYADLAEPWAAGRYVPLAWSRSAVERYAESRIVLVPAESVTARSLG